MDWAHPLVVALLSGCSVAILGLLANRFVIRPKYCFDQRENITTEIKTAVKNNYNHLEKESNSCHDHIEKELGEVKIELDKHKTLSHAVFARKDVLEPQMKQMGLDVTYVRKRLDQIAQARRLPPLAGEPDDGHDNLD